MDALETLGMPTGNPHLGEMADREDPRVKPEDDGEGKPEDDGEGKWMTFDITFVILVAKLDICTSNCDQQR